MFHVVHSINRFRSIIRTIRKFYKFISIEDVESFFFNRAINYNCCHLTFDDGDRTFYENVFPVLNEFNIPASIYVSPQIIENGSNYWFQDIEYLISQIGEQRLKTMICKIKGYDYDHMKDYLIYSILKTLKISDIFEIIKAAKQEYNIELKDGYNITKNQFTVLKDSKLISIGPHTINHPILSNESYNIAEYEIIESIKQLSHMTERDIKYFAYPDGVPDLDFTEREKLIFKENKIKLAFSTKFRYYNQNSDPLNIPRIGVVPRDNIILLLIKIFFIKYWDNFREILWRGKTEATERKKISNYLKDINTKMIISESLVNKNR